MSGYKVGYKSGYEKKYAKMRKNAKCGRTVFKRKEI